MSGAERGDGHGGLCSSCSLPATVCHECVRAVALKWWAAIARHPGDSEGPCRLCEVGRPVYCGACFVDAVTEHREALRAAGVEVGEPPLHFGSGQP